MKSTSGEDTVIAEVTAKDLEYYMNLIDKAPAGFEMIDSNNFEGSSAVGKYNQTACYKEIIHEKKSQSMSQTFLWSYFKKLP